MALARQGRPVLPKICRICSRVEAEGWLISSLKVYAGGFAVICYRRGFCRRRVPVLGGSRGFSICQSARIAFTRVADTAGTSAHTTYGGNISFSIDLWFIIPLCLAYVFVLYVP